MLTHNQSTPPRRPRPLVLVFIAVFIAASLFLKHVSLVSGNMLYNFISCK